MHLAAIVNLRVCKSTTIKRSHMGRQAWYLEMVCTGDSENQWVVMVGSLALLQWINKLTYLTIACTTNGFTTETHLASVMNQSWKHKQSSY